jgi:hypothetical protein
MQRKFVKEYLFIFFELVGGAILILALSGCSNFRFRSTDLSNAGSGLLQQSAIVDCRQKLDMTEYSECIKRVNSTFNDWRTQKQQKDDAPTEK